MRMRSRNTRRSALRPPPCEYLILPAHRDNRHLPASRHHADRTTPTCASGQAGSPRSRPPPAVRLGGEPDVEVPAGDASVLDGVGAQLGGDQGQGLVDVAVVGVAPGVRTLRDEQSGEAGAARGGGEGHGELGGSGGAGAAAGRKDCACRRRDGRDRRATSGDACTEACCTRVGRRARPGGRNQPRAQVRRAAQTVRSVRTVRSSRRRMLCGPPVSRSRSSAVRSSGESLSATAPRMRRRMPVA